MQQEYTRTLEEPIDSDRNIFSLLDDQANRSPENSLVEYIGDDGKWHSFTATQFRNNVIYAPKK